MNRRLLLACLALLSLAVSASADDYVRYLVPTVATNITGANGSTWVTELTIHNPRERELGILGDVCSGSPFVTPPCADIFFIRPQTSRAVQLQPSPFGTDGAFLYVPVDPTYPTTPMTLRVRDLSKNATSFGTEVPIARLTDFVQLVTITDVPTDSRFRATLRIYNSSEAPREVQVRVFTLEGNTPIAEQRVQLKGIVTVAPDLTPLHPAYAQLDPLSAAVRAAGPRVRIEIDDPARVIVSPPPPPIWAFVSITNNETQQVTTITPHP